MLAFKNISAFLPTRLPSRLFIIRQSSAFRLILKNRDLAKHLVGPVAEPLQLRLSACKECGLYSCRPSVRFLFEKKSSDEKAEGSSVFQELVESREQPQTQLTVGAKVVQAGKDVSYFGIILIGFAITGALLWFLVSELFLGFSPNRVYAHALKKVKANAEVVEAIGEPIMGHGETTSRGRRRHVSYQEYLVEGENYMRVKFYVKGSKRKGTVHADVKQGSRGNFDYRFIFVELSPYETIVVLDNR
ncbi:mitochondrial import inner membrane translocase subunit Tim21-like [Porites lutea]|uniref:mitochondrial import inner membrane translocase subunit Tim21-like n=1 Tax=Porites lutea TaxID=51062 RepID=UPI003CC5B80A